MRLALTPILSKAAASSILAALFTLMWWGILQPIFGFFVQEHATLGVLERQVARMRQLKESAPKFEALLSQEDGTATFLYHAPSDTLAAAEIVQDVSRLAEKAKLNVASSQILSVPSGLKPKRVSVSLAMTGGAKGLVTFLAGLQNGARLFDVRRLKVQAPAATPSGIEPRLRIEAEITGFYETGRQKP